MNLAGLSIKRPIFITCIVILMLALGWLSLRGMGADLFPSVSFPIVTVTTPYPGAGPKEVELSISQPLEDEMSTLPGIKSMRSINREGVSTVIAEFVLETDVKYAEQLVRDRMSAAKRKFPDDAEESIVRRIDPADQPILAITLTAKDMPEAALFDLADQVIRPKIEQVNQVGLVDIYGGRKREIRVELDRAKLKSHEISASMVANRIKVAGQDTPAGKIDESKLQTVIHTVGEFKTLKDIETTIVSFFANDVPVSVGEVGQVKDTLEDEKTRTFVNGQKGLIFSIYRQSGANTIAVVKALRNRVDKINAELKTSHPGAEMTVVRDSSKNIQANVDDVKESIAIGIILTILVVYFFLANGRSTFITSLALPNSLLGAFILMAAAGFTVNVMTLLALSLAVGLLVDDAIVVRENIFRHVEMGKSAREAALQGTQEVSLAVVATTLTVIAVFGPIAFLKGVVGQFFKEFGLTVCFAMAISLFDALTIAPMMSTYFAGDLHKKRTGVWANTMGRVLEAFNRFQDRLEVLYEKVLIKTLAHPLKALSMGVAVFALSLVAAKYVPKTFLPPQDFGEFQVASDMPPGTSLDAMSETAKKVEEVIRSNKEVRTAVLTVGTRDGEANISDIFVELVAAKERKGVNTTQLKDRLREQLKDFKVANPVVKDIDLVGAGQRPFNVNIIGNDLDALEKYTSQVFALVKDDPSLKDPDVSFRPGKPEFQVVLENKKAESLGISGNLLGLELRTQLEGTKPAVFRENSREYNIRVRLKDDQRNLKKDFAEIYVPNINNSLVKLSNVARPVETTGPANINRQDRGRYAQITADIAPNGPGMEGATKRLQQVFEKELPLPAGMRYAFVGQAENFKELLDNMIMAAALGILFIYLVLASLYESFITPFTIMLVLPLAACGAFYALLISGKSLDLFSMIGCIMLLGVATKNSILIVDYTNQLLQEGMERREAIIKAAKTRLRPILMTTFALIAGMIPIAIGLNEASKQRTSMGIAIIGGLISSTLLTLIVVPAAFSYIDRFRVWSSQVAARMVGSDPDKTEANAH